MPRSVFADRAREVVDVDGWTVAAAYDDPAGEYAALRERAAVVDLAFRRRVRATGADRVEFLQGMLTADVRKLADGDGAAALLLTEQGRVVADLIVLATSEGIVLDARADATARAKEALERYIIADDVELVPDDETHALGVLGPEAGAVLGACGIPAPPVAPYAHASHETPAGPARVVRVPTPGPGGFFCLVSSTHVRTWFDACVAAAAVPAGFTALETVRIESVLPASDADVGLDTIALEAPLEFAIAYDKGCYLGQEVIERVTARGHVNRRLVPLIVDGVAPPARGATVVVDGKEVGRVTSAAWSWRLGKPVALAFVRREHLAPGTVVELQGAAGPMRATVSASPVG